MKKVLSIILALLIVFTLSGCKEEEKVDFNEFVEELIEPNFYTKEEVDAKLDEITFYLELFYDDEFQVLVDRVNELNKIYTQDEIYTIIYLYDLNQSIYLIEQNAIDEDRELTSEEQLLIVGYEMIINQIEGEIE